MADAPFGSRAQGSLSQVTERENARSLHLEASGKDYNFSFVGKPPTDADWARYRKLARK
jgi:hypothetical protein